MNAEQLQQQLQAALAEIERLRLDRDYWRARCERGQNKRRHGRALTAKSLRDAMVELRNKREGETS